jgi:hypothetical protein
MFKGGIEDAQGKLQLLRQAKVSASGRGNRISLTSSLTPSVDGMVESRITMLEAETKSNSQMLRSILSKIDGLSMKAEDHSGVRTPGGQEGHRATESNVTPEGAKDSTPGGDGCTQ